MAVQQVLVGFYDIPKSVEQPLQLVINPEGAEARRRMVVWNRNDNRVSPGQPPKTLSKDCGQMLSSKVSYHCSRQDNAQSNSLQDS